MSLAKLLGRAAVLLVSWLWMGGISPAQTQGEITGVVTDSTGAVLVGAAITVTNPQTNFTRRVLTNSAGNYVFPALLPGLYNVTVTAQGFQSEIRSQVELQVEQIARIDFQLKLGSITESVEVNAGAPLLSTEDATIGTVIENRRIVDLPLNGRNFLQLVALSPNVSANFDSGGGAPGRLGGDRASQQLSVAGGRREFTYFTLDGVDNTDVDFNTYVFLPSIDALQEFKVQTGVYSAEFGRETAQVNVSTKSGTNEYHGAAFEFLRNSVLDARPYAFTSSVPAKAPFKWNQYGFTLGGPIQIPKLFNGKDRLFFMTNFEGFRLHNQTQHVYSTAPDSMRSGDFSQIASTTRIRDPVTGQPFPNNVVPASRLAPTSRQLLGFVPTPNIAGAGLANNYLALDNDVTNKDQFTERIDFVESSKSSWFGRYSWDDEANITPALYLNGTGLTTHVDQWMIDNTRVLKPTLVNQFRFGYSHFYNSLSTQLANTRDVVKELGIPGLAEPPAAAWGIPNVAILGYSTFGDSTDGPYVNYNYTFQWADDLSWTHGKHSIKAGVDIRRDRFNNLGNQYSRGLFTFQNQATGYGFADFMLGYMYQNQDSVGLAVAQFRATSQSYYFTDTWKIRPNLTVDLGMRYEYVPPWSDKGDSFVNLYMPYTDETANAPANHHPVFVRNGTGDFYANTLIRFNPAIQVARDGRLGDRLIAADRKDWAPRLGIAWSVSPKWTVRFGAGFFYVQDMGNAFFDLTRNLSGRVQVTADTQAHNLTWSNPFASSGANACGVPSPPFVCISKPLVLASAYDRPTPYVIQYETNVQRQLSNSTVLEAGYLGNQGHRLQRMVHDNQPALGSGTISQRSPYPELGLIQYVISGVDSNYHSLSVKLTRRFAAGLTFLAGYTFSKSIDDGSGIRPLGTDPQFPNNNYCIRCERGLSVFDARHRFVTSALYDLPFGKGRQFLTHGIASNVIGGWEISSIVTASSGFPLTILAGTDASNTNNNFARPNVTGSAADLPAGQRGTADWFNIEAFALQPAQTFGDEGRGTVTSPGIFNWDFSTLKNFNFTESRYLQFRFEAFNVLNHANWGDPVTTLGNDHLDASGRPIAGTGNFGVISSTRTAMRQLQFSLKLIF
jgi:hypothetical protein